MFLYFDKKGNLKEQINDEAIRQGSNVNKFYIFCEQEGEAIWYRFLTPETDGFKEKPLQTPIQQSTQVVEVETLTELLPYSASRDLKFFNYYKPYKFFVVDFNQDVLNAGKTEWVGQFWLVDKASDDVVSDTTGTSILGLGLIPFFVIGTTNEIASDENISLSQWNYLIGLINEFGDDFVSLSDFDELSERVSDNEQNIDIIKDDIVDVNRQISSARNSIADNKQSIETIDENIKVVEQNIQSVQTEVNRHGRNITALQKMATEFVNVPVVIGSNGDYEINSDYIDEIKSNLLKWLLDTETLDEYKELKGIHAIRLDYNGSEGTFEHEYQYLFEQRTQSPDDIEPAEFIYSNEDYEFTVEQWGDVLGGNYRVELYLDKKTTPPTIDTTIDRSLLKLNNVIRFNNNMLPFPNAEGYEYYEWKCKFYCNATPLATGTEYAGIRIHIADPNNNITSIGYILSNGFEISVYDATGWVNGSESQYRQIVLTNLDDIPDGWDDKKENLYTFIKFLSTNAQFGTIYERLRLVKHTVQILVNNNVNLYIELITNEATAFNHISDTGRFKFLSDLRSHVYINPTNNGTLFGCQFDLIYMLDLNASPMAIRIYNIVTGVYTYSTNITFISDTITEF